MSALLYPSLAVVAWLALAIKALQLRRGGGSPARYAVCSALGLLASTFTVSTPSVWALVDRITHVGNLAGLWAHLSVVGFSLTLQVMLIWWAHDPVDARRRARHRLLAACVVVICLIALFIAAGPMPTNTTDFVAANVHRPHFAVYLLVYLAVFAVGLVDIVRLCWPFAAVAGRSWLRRGLRVTTIGAVLGLIYCLTRAVAVAAALRGRVVLQWEWLAQISASLGALLVIAGLTMPSWGPGMSRALDSARMRRQYSQLYPLWSAICEATGVGASDGADSSDMTSRLYRRVIEVYDGRLALRPYLDEDAAKQARHDAVARGLGAEHADAFAEAARIRGALAAVGGGGGGVAGQTVAGGSQAAGASADLSDEVARLVRVSRAFASMRTERLDRTG